MYRQKSHMHMANSFRMKQQKSLNHRTSPLSDVIRTIDDEKEDIKAKINHNLDMDLNKFSNDTALTIQEILKQRDVMIAKINKEAGDLIERCENMQKEPQL